MYISIQTHIDTNIVTVIIKTAYKKGSIEIFQ